MSDPEADATAANFARNSAYAVPQANYQTTLNPQQESGFQSWVKANKIPFDPSPTSDYDMRGFYKAAQSGDPRANTAVNPNDGQIHYDDKWKTPYHKSFSNESQFATKGAPAWNNQDQLVLPNGNVVYDERAQQSKAPMAGDLTAVYTALKNADAAGDVESARKLAAYLQTAKPKGGRSYDSLGNGQVAPTGSPAAHDAQSPVSQSGFQNFLAGAGKATYDLGRGAGQMVGAVSRQDVADSRAQDAPLMQTGAGKAGMVAGTVADLLPAAFIPGANTMLGSAAIGAGSGLLQPSTSTSETLTNTGVGGIAGPVGLGVGRALGVGYNALKSTMQPFFNSGQDAIAARTLQTFAGGQAASQDALTSMAQNGQNVLPGVQPTTAELANNAGLSQLERQLSINPDTLNQMTQRMQANRGAMTGALSDIAGNPADMQAAKDARTAITTPLYDKASQATVTADPALNALLQRPSMQSAVGRATTLAAERGDTLGTRSVALSSNPYATAPVEQTTFNGKNIQYLKMALNDMANSGPQMGMGSHEVGAVKGTLGSFNEWTQANVPELRAADAAYANASKPINQMEIGQQLSNKLNPALNDFGTTPRINANAYAQAVRNGDSIAADVTGNKAATLASTLSPQQMQTVTQIGEQLARRANAADLGRGPGSNTAQNLVSQNMLRQVLGPMGLPESWGEGVAKNTMMQSLMRPAQFIAKAGEEKVLTKVANAALDPVEAKRLLQMGIDPSVAKVIWARQGLFGTLGTSSALLGNSAQ